MHSPGSRSFLPFFRAAAVSLLMGAAAASAQHAKNEPIDVVFACQYGYAKSLVAAKHFERAAAAEGLNVRVLARGLTPNPEVPTPLAASIEGDGFALTGFQPTALDAQASGEAEFIVLFGIDNPFESSATTLRWDDVSALSEDYGKARGEITAHFASLIAQIKASQR
jgi:protein-tyrosine-phosphatase